MKKTLSAAITSALVIGIMSTSFASENPFRDVSVDHWSFGAVKQLADEGVIEGYGDSTFRGDVHITRYEMAQMVAKAMAKENVSATNQGIIDKLANEYANELRNLGVRIADLEEKTDNIIIEGTAKFESVREKYDDVKGTETAATLELDITAQVNDKWAAKSVLEAESDLKNDGSTEVQVKQIYAEGPLLGANTKLGRFGAFDAENFSNGGLIIDTEVSGAEFAFNGKLTTLLTIGRLDADEYFLTEGGDQSNYKSIQLMYPFSDKLKANAGYYYISNDQSFSDGNSVTDNNRIWSAGLDYQLTPDFILGGLYAASNLKEAAGSSSGVGKAYSIQFTYKGADPEVPNSYGIWAAYRHLGEMAVIAPTYDGAGVNEKGLEIGMDYMLAKNILGKVVYFDGKEISTDVDMQRIYGQLEFSF